VPGCPRPDAMRDDDDAISRADPDGLTIDPERAVRPIVTQPPQISVTWIRRRSGRRLRHPITGQDAPPVREHAATQREEADACIVPQRGTDTASAMLGAGRL